MSNLQELIDADNENIAKSRKILTGFDPELSSSLDTAAAMFKTFSHCMKGALDDSADLADLHECAKKLGVEPDALITLIRSTAQGDPFLERARTVWGRLFAHQARVIVFLLIQRQYMWAATDLLKGRLTPVLGYERLQAESVALLFLILDDPTIGHDWLRITTPDKGTAFFRTHRKSITKLTESMGLGGAYEMGSGFAFHVRPMSAAQALSFPKDSPGTTRLSYQEFPEDDPFVYFLAALQFLRTQDRVFQALGTAFPKVSDPIWPERVLIFGHTVDGLWEKLEQKYPEECAQFRRIASGA